MFLFCSPSDYLLKNQLWVIVCRSSSGAYKLAEILEQIELKGKLEDESVYALTQEAITTADLTRFAFLDVKMG